MLNEIVEIILLAPYVPTDNRRVLIPKRYRARVVAVENDVPSSFEVVVGNTVYCLSNKQVEVID